MLTVLHPFEKEGPCFRGYQQERQTFRKDQPSYTGKVPPDQTLCPSIIASPAARLKLA